MTTSLGAGDPYIVELDRFHGPLDLLLHLIRNHDVDIFDIPIAHITEHFLRAIQEVDRLELERAGEFLEMAATLIRIKAQMLFPRRVDDDGEDPRADLVRRLLEYEHFREAADRLKRAERERSALFAKGFVEPRPPAMLSDLPLETGWEELWEAALRLAERLDAPDEGGYRFAAQPIRIEEKIDFVVSTLGRLSRVEFLALVEPWGTRMHAVVSLLACLELAKRHVLTLRQTEPFSPLWIYPTQVGV